ncbi:MAG: carboxylesterase family protein, partial [Acidimicrobiales bacterium]
MEVDTDRGGVRGRQPLGVAEFLGIRYARAPVGERRFRPPVAERWSGVRDALEYPPSAIQAAVRPGAGGPLSALRGASAQPSTDEDCLGLNVWTADLDGRAPVMVWIHGGGYTTGSGSNAAVNGARLAKARGVVVVTLNHRLGLLGFLDLSHRLGPDYADSANVGLLDLVAALSWVHTNITAFGGDPDNVTIFGCSGGGGKVSALLAMPAARGLFHRAIVQS